MTRARDFRVARGRKAREASMSASARSSLPLPGWWMVMAPDGVRRKARDHSSASSFGECSRGVPAPPPDPQGRGGSPCGSLRGMEAPNQTTDGVKPPFGVG